MLSNFKNRFMQSPPPDESTEPQQVNDAVARQNWAIAMEETVSIEGCACLFCARHAEIGDDAVSPDNRTRSPSSDRSLPSTRGVVQVLYPPSYLGAYSPFPDPPPYFSGNSPSFPEAPSLPISSTTADSEGTPLSRSCPDPLAQGPSLTGVPSQGATSGRVLLVEPNPPTIITSSEDQLEDTEPLPAYTRFDQRRPRFPIASDVLGPYPPFPVLSRTAH